MIGLGGVMMSRGTSAPGVWRRRAVIAGAVIGALIGLGAANIYVRRMEESGRAHKVSVREWVSIAGSLISLLKRITSLGL